LVGFWWALGINGEDYRVGISAAGFGQRGIGWLLPMEKPKKQFYAAADLTWLLR
jgi:hypothetical protein